MSSTTHDEDKLIIELAVLPMLASAVIETGVAKDQQSQPEVVEAKRLFSEAFDEAMSGLKHKDKQRLKFPAYRLRDLIMKPYIETGIPVVKFGLITFHIMRELTDCEYLTIPESSPLSRGLDILIEALEDEANIEARNKSAMKNARQILRRLQEQGFYQLVVIGETV
jgi:hypothetical protein